MGRVGSGKLSRDRHVKLETELGQGAEVFISIPLRDRRGG